MQRMNAFSVDVEDYYHVTAFEKHLDRNDWGGYPQHVVENTNRVMELLSEFDVQATFFVLGWVADQYPDLIAQIAASGHELGSHSYWHHLVYELTPEEFRADLRRSKEAIGTASGVTVKTYRAPSFSITRRSMWALDILAEEGFTLDSSVFPIIHDRYGMPGAEANIHQLATTHGPIWEFPLAIKRIAGLRIPVSGGGYFRLYPYAFTSTCLAAINRTDAPFMFYMHPWELHADQPRLGVGSRVSRFRHYVNLRTTAAKLSRLLSQFRFGRICDVLKEHHAETKA